MLAWTQNPLLWRTKNEPDGKTVCPNGWVNRYRNLGGVLFVDLRDRKGIVQVVFHPEHNPTLFQQAEAIRNEFVIMVKGRVEQRPKRDDQSGDGHR